MNASARGTATQQDPRNTRLRHFLGLQAAGAPASLASLQRDASEEQIARDEPVSATPRNLHWRSV